MIRYLMLFVLIGSNKPLVREISNVDVAGVELTRVE